MKVASQMQQSGTLGGATAGLPLNKFEHHRSKSVATPSSIPSKQRNDTSSWKYKTISPANPLSHFHNGKPPLERMTPQRASQGPFLNSHSVPARPRLDVSPFSRSRSRVFYASEDTWTNVNNAKMAEGPNASVDVAPCDLDPFKRSVHHRTSSGRKSCDSGFSDSGDAVSSSGKSKQGSMERSPPRKVQKWASTSPIKAFLKSHEISTTQGLPKLSMLKCCVGIGPGFPFYYRQKKIQDSEVPKSPPRDSCQMNFDGGTTLDAKAKDCKGTLTPVPPRKAECAEKNASMGTWPRIRKNKKNEIFENPAYAPDKKSYHSTRLKSPLQLHGKDATGSLNRQKGSAANHSESRITASIQNSSLHQWSKDLLWTTEDECMNTLQSKTVVRDVIDVIAMTNRNAKDTILAVRGKREAISVDFAKLKRKIDKQNFRRTESIYNRISINVDSLLHSCKIHQGRQEASIQQYHRLVTAHSNIVLHLLERAQCGELNKESLHSLHDTLFALQSAIFSLTDALIQIHIKSIVDVLEEAPSLYSLKVAIGTIEELAIQDVHLCQNISATGGIHVLLTICVDPRYKAVRARAIRALAMLCCVSESIREMEECGGVECITDILAERSSSEEEKREAAGFIAQVTSPTLDSHHVQGLSENIPSLIRSLTELAKVTKSCDSFLLATAAIGNLTFLSNHACLHLHHSKTVWTLVSICRKADSRSESVFVKDQVATILANMSSLPEGREDVIDSGGLTVLLCFLQIRPCMVSSTAEISACERVQQKSAIALSRLCSNASVAKQVIILQGVHRLVRLCKDERERNQSDAVLVACLAVLRKIASACGFEEFKDLDAMELVEPRLLDTFLIYSSRQESYV